MALARRQTRFLLVFAVLLISFYAIITIDTVDTHVVLPFTAGLARLSGGALNVIGERVHVRTGALQGIGHLDAHAVLERAQLLELLAQLQCPCGQLRQPQERTHR